MVQEEHCCQVPYTTCRQVAEEHCTMTPTTTCSLEPYCYTKKVTRCVPVCEPVCDPCGPTSFKMSGAEWYGRLMDRVRHQSQTSAADLN
jgi:hypothetical protein